MGKLEEKINPYSLVSFPRTGSHWLRMMIELYYHKDLSIDTFQYSDCKMCDHFHDYYLTPHGVPGCQIGSWNVIYLYRKDVSSTIYSLIKFFKLDLNLPLINFYSNLYGNHLNKWLINENFSNKKIVIVYENLIDNIYNEFKKIVDFLGGEYIKENIITDISKEDIKVKKDKEDVINLDDCYEMDKQTFGLEYDSYIKDIILNVNQNIGKYL